MTATDYSTYLRIDELLALQQPLTAGADDEMLFIIVHQAYELWFKLVLHELGLARDQLMPSAPWAATPHLRRAVAVEELLYQQLGVLETMTPEGFLRFRDPLAPASGFQSLQFREIEVLSGSLEPAVVPSEAGRAVLARRAGEPTLWDGVVACLQTLVTDASPADVLPALLDLYRHHATSERAALHQVCELLVDHDEAIARWRFRHSLMAAREIGRRQGTGGSLGVSYLESTLEKRFYPLLWEVRSQL
ncbi:MAG TPA: tryptophan 2,3-dioxygenase family protein [Acidimicrobiales bacterium]|jgi:tryptophan 2,3-dioxygenase|nr:tryptophan 2,3-dioxygenase family protein [Acidimicrobiales bacterium]